MLHINKGGSLSEELWRKLRDITNAPDLFMLGYLTARAEDLAIDLAVRLVPLKEYDYAASQQDLKRLMALVVFISDARKEMLQKESYALADRVYN